MADIEAVGRALAIELTGKIDRTLSRAAAIEPVHGSLTTQAPDERFPHSPRTLAAEKLNIMDLPQREDLQTAIQRIALALEESQATLTRRIVSVDETATRPDTQQLASGTQSQPGQQNIRHLEDIPTSAGWAAAVAIPGAVTTMNVNEHIPLGGRKINPDAAAERREALSLPPSSLRMLILFAAALLAFALMS